MTDVVIRERNLDTETQTRTEGRSCKDVGRTPCEGRERDWREPL